MHKGHTEQGLCAWCNQAEANRAPALLITIGGCCSDGGSRKCPEDRLNIPRSETTDSMADEWALVTMEHGGEGRVDRQLVEHRRQGPLERCFRKWFVVLSC